MKHFKRGTYSQAKITDMAKYARGFEKPFMQRIKDS
jgi:hypothetical protein